MRQKANKVNESEWFYVTAGTYYILLPLAIESIQSICLLQHNYCFLLGVFFVVVVALFRIVVAVLYFNPIKSFFGLLSNFLPLRRKGGRINSLNPSICRGSSLHSSHPSPHHPNDSTSSDLFALFIVHIR